MFITELLVLEPCHFQDAAERYKSLGIDGFLTGLIEEGSKDYVLRFIHS
jgi:hypothetical protein